MAAETKKKKNSKSASSQSRGITESKVKRANAKNDQSGQNNDQINRSILIKPVAKNSVIRTVNRTLGISDVSAISQFHKKLIINRMKRFMVFEAFTPFDRKLTFISWHPKYPKIFVSGSKGGDLMLRNLNGGDDYFIPGIGSGGSILGLKHGNEDPYTIYTASLTGKISWFNFQDVKCKELLALPCNSYNWFTSMDVCKYRRYLLTGDCKGNAYLLAPSGEPIWQNKKLHAGKVTHIEFNVHDPNIFVTSSNDHFMKLWDMRSISSSKSKRQEPLAVFPHEKALNSAYFSPSNGVSILTTDQHSELRVYSGPSWNNVIKIIHPHRQFQHITQIKATWHPLEDIIIVGRYPDDNIKEDDPRTIDFYDGSNGQLLHQILSPTMNIASLNAMNATGEVLATAAGCNVSFLKDELLLKGYKSELESDDDTEKSKTSSKSMNKKRKNEAIVTKNVPSNKRVSLWSLKK